MGFILGAIVAIICVLVGVGIANMPKKDDS